MKALRTAVCWMVMVMAASVAAGNLTPANKAAVNPAPVQPLTISLSLSATGAPVVVLNNPTALQVTLLHPAAANALAFVLFDNDGALLSPAIQHKKAAAPRMITLQPQSSQTFTLPLLSYATAGSVAHYSLRPNTDYRLLAIYRPLGLNGDGVASAEIRVQIKPPIANNSAADSATDSAVANTLVLHSAINKDQQLALVYSKSMEDCVQLSDKNLAALHSGAEALCKPGKKISNRQPSAAYLQVEPGKQVQLCNENDTTQCSNSVIVKGFADVEGCFDMNGSAASGLIVSLRPQAGQAETAKTDAQGCYNFPDVNLAQVFRLMIDIPAIEGIEKSVNRDVTSAGGCIYVKDKEISDTRVVIKQDNEANQQLWIETGGCFDLPTAILGKRTVIELSASVQ